jgi:predicted N-acetyltransferase YhbS
MTLMAGRPPIRALKRAQPRAEPGAMLRDCAAAPDLEVQAAGPDDAALAQLLDVHFDGCPGLLQEFPLLLGRANRSRCRVLGDGHGGYRAHAAWRRLELVTSHGRLAAAGIGMVTTHRAWRRRGLASRVVEDCVQAALREGCDLALLFGSVRGLYARLGFQPAGRERWNRIPSDGAAACAADVRAASSEDVPALLELLQAQPLRVERTRGELERLLAIPGTRAHVLERAGRVAAYAIHGKGRDLQGVVHEWAGAAPDVAALLPALAARPGGPEWVVSPASLPSPLGPASPEERLAPLAQLRILRPERCGGSDPERSFGSGGRAGDSELYVWGLDSI